MAAKKALKKFRGVYYTESKQRKWRERPDRVYWINFKDVQSGKLRWERCGWASEGWTPEAAQRKRFEVLEQDRSGDYKPREQRKSEQLLFGELMQLHYLPWAEHNKKRARDDGYLYGAWLKNIFGDKKLNEISPIDLERLKKDMREAGRADATIRHALCLVRQAFNKADDWGIWSGENPCSKVRFPKPNNLRQRFLSKDEALILIDALYQRSPQIAQVATISLYCGLRLSEVLNIKWGNVDLQNKILNIMDTKSGEARPVFLTAPVIEVLNELKHGEPEELLFKTKQGRPVAWLSKTFSRVVDELGFNKGVEDRRQRVSFHTLRHTYASWAVMSGIPLYVVGKALGHKTTAMTERYSHLAPDSQRSAFEAVEKYSLKAVHDFRELVRSD